MAERLDGGAVADASERALDWDLAPLVHLLASRSKAAAEAAWVDALPTISEGFPPEIWGCEHSVNPYGPDAHANLMKTEIRSDFKAWLNEANVSLDDYTQAVGEVQYVSVQIYLRSLFERALNNKGWRIRVLGFPALGVIACGLASHYQGTQNQNLMGEASARIRSRALEVLSATQRVQLEAWPSAVADDWEERGLMPEPVTHIGNLDISTYDDGNGARLRMIRNTTVKKEVSTFFAIKGMDTASFGDDGPLLLSTLRDIAIELGKPGSQ
ncbi:hypothetical protein R4144_00805 [Gordonia amicalis]|uniref:hypothetical protein n=1 Tax=Gordonia amicalis TaxID=89053 RepID=UPI002954A232|nr:hypothetical protein [Gordonia amicalis]MDV7171956.1 hypothetical protein [Gordonia amicalis]